jgi:hypothetical protein
MVNPSWRTQAAAGVFAVLLIGGCTAAGSSESDDGENSGESHVSSLTAAARRERAEHLRNVSASRGLINGWMIAGIGNAETQLSHCWSELTWACKGPVSADCGGGPVVAGAGDGPCSAKQGGLGMFQFDAGTFSQTLAKYGNDVLTVDGNIDHAITYAVNMVVNSKYISGVTTEAQAVDWMNGVSVGSTDYKTWIKTVTHYYNGCVPGACSVYTARYNHYDDSTREIYNDMGDAFWKPLQPIGVSWNRKSNDVYDLGADAPAGVAKVKYLIDGFLIGEATRDNPDTAAVETTFPDTYKFKNALNERLFEALGYDSKGHNVARGIGLIDSIPGTAVFIREMGEQDYEIGLERAAAEVAWIELSVDGKLLTDTESGTTKSTRNAVRHKYNKLGERSFDIETFNADGSSRGHLKRDFSIE